MDGEQSTSGKKEYDPLSCSAIIYRALLKKQWIDEDTARVKADAYFLRRNKNEKGLSVNIAARCSPKQCAAKFNKCFALASLHVGRIRDLGLDVIQDSSDHANLIGLPDVNDDTARAERLAGLLAKQSRIIGL